MSILSQRHDVSALVEVRSLTHVHRRDLPTPLQLPQIHECHAKDACCVERINFIVQGVSR
jgi:hypothetical protein